MKPRRYIRILVIGLLLLTTSLQAQPDEDFVIASIIVADPGKALYSGAGHVAIHMRCPEHSLDYVFSYESEEIPHRILAFFAGTLKTGLFAIPIDDYLEPYRQEGRGVREYRLNLPVQVKQELWRVLDDHMLESRELQFNYITHGCAHSSLMLLKEGLDTIPIKYAPWPEQFKLSRRELAGRQLKCHPWQWSFLSLMCNGSINWKCSNEDKLIMPADLVETLLQAEVLGHPLLEHEPTVLLPSTTQLKPARFTPTMLALLLLVLTIVCICLKQRWMDYVLLAIQTLLGMATVYLVFFSKLCCTEWSWLIIPLNPLPLIFWKWRRHWVLPYAIVLAAWLIFIVIWPHALTDWPYIVFTITLMVSYIYCYWSNKSLSLCIRKKP